jgi:streptogramin lyase
MQRSSTQVLVLLAIVAGLTAGPNRLASQTAGDYISGRVVSEGAVPEAGVWVVAESKDVMPDDGRGPDSYRKIVVTDDAGRFLLPDLPSGSYDVWVRGYGLVDSRASWTLSGQHIVAPGTRDLQITVETAQTPQEAARIYPANYWYSLLDLPPATAFPGDGEHIASGMESQSEWLGQLKLSCNLCHQIGTSATRLATRGAWDVAVRKSPNMVAGANSFGYPAFLDVFEDWSTRIHAGEVPPAPPRPSGVERNVVITQWEVADLYAHPHDISATDRRTPTSNANGPVYLVDYAQDWLIIIDPVDNSWKRVRVPTHPNDLRPTRGYSALGVAVDGGHTNFEGAYDHSLSTPHNPMMDEHGRVWMTTRISSWRPEYCPEGSQFGNSYTMYDPETGEMEVIPVCFRTHHLEFADGPEGRLWSCTLGYLDTNTYDPNDPMAAQGWADFMADSDGDGQGDTQLGRGGYGVYPSPDGSAWNTQIGPYPGRINRWDPATEKFETYQPPYGSGPRGITVDSNGVVWTALAGSGHLARFDRSKCGRTWGLGDQCPEGWTLWKIPGPSFQGFEPQRPEDNASSTMLYYIWVDRYNASGFGENTVIVNGTGADALFLFDPQTEQFTTIRVPYPLQYNSRGSDARVDDTNAGWKGRGIWSMYSSSSAMLTETKRPSLVYMQLRPSPLAQ